MKFHFPYETSVKFQNLKESIQERFSEFRHGRWPSNAQTNHIRGRRRYETIWRGCVSIPELRGQARLGGGVWRCKNTGWKCRTRRQNPSSDFTGNYAVAARWLGYSYLTPMCAESTLQRPCTAIPFARNCQ